MPVSSPATLAHPCCRHHHHHPLRCHRHRSPATIVAIAIALAAIAIAFSLPATLITVTIALATLTLALSVAHQPHHQSLLPPKPSLSLSHSTLAANAITRFIPLALFVTRHPYPHRLRLAALALFVTCSHL
jgi:energy-coupling factor transporter transmembrane protein EcfT